MSKQQEEPSKKIDDIDYETGYQETIINNYLNKGKNKKILESEVLKIAKRDRKITENLLIAAAFSMAIISITFALSSTDNNYNFIFGKKDYQLQFLIVDETGTPLENVQILYPSSQLQSSKTDSSGFLKTFLPKSYEQTDILFKKSGYQPLILNLNLKEASNNNQIITLKKDPVSDNRL